MTKWTKWSAVFVVVLGACGGPTKSVRDFANEVEGLHREVVEGLPAWSAGRSASIPEEIDALLPAESHRAIDRYEAKEAALVEHKTRMAALLLALEAVPAVLANVRKTCDAADTARRGVNVDALLRQISSAWTVVEVRAREAGAAIPSIHRRASDGASR